MIVPKIGLCVYRHVMYVIWSYWARIDIIVREYCWIIINQSREDHNLIFGTYQGCT